MLTTVRQRPSDPTATPIRRYELDADGSYRIDRYDTAPAFCSFLPGIAGLEGVPLWCMYVNRAQAVVSFGVQDKDHAIAEFLPANWAYQLVGIQGFRTFCKIDGTYYEPFRDVPVDPADCVRTMRIRPDVLEIAEANARRGLLFAVQYFSPVNQPLGSLVHRLTITNTSRDPRRLSVLDGLALILPAGFTDRGLKTLRHIYEAYASVRLTCSHVAFYSAKVAAHDEAEVVRMSGGNFYAAWVARDQRWLPAQPIVDPGLVFGSGHDLVTPRRFIASDALDRAAQVWENRLPCALAPLQAVLGPGESVELVAVTGFAPNEDMLAPFLARFTSRASIDQALADSHRVLESVTAPADTVSGEPLLDAYVRQNYLDNVLRGGVPRLLPSVAGPTLLHVYARRHGDLERDYNFFILPASPLSSGAGNYRDICQNRRWDVWFYPCVQEQEIKTFVTLLQADGYNPLSIEGYRWRLAAGEDARQLCPPCDAIARDEFRRILQRGFQPGELLQWANVHSVAAEDGAPWLDSILTRCERTLVAHGHGGGYWIDHWTYVTDLLEAFAAVYPDRVPDMLAGAADVGWFDEGAYIVPRDEKYVLRGAGPLQFKPVRDGEPAPRPLPPVTVLGKLCALLAVKAVSFDYDCRGIEMEAGRPGWNDSLNGLPGLFGSSTCEAIETARLAAWLRQHLPRMPDIALPSAVADFIEQVVADLAAPEYSWDRAATLREQFRARIRATAGAGERRLSGEQLKALLAGVERRACAAVAKSIDPKTGLIHTYYVNKPELVTAPVRRQDSPHDRLAKRVQKFIPQPLPLYLEGQVHWLRVQRQPDRARAIYRAVRQSPLFDATLKMYKLNECLASCPPEIGRARTFTRGWFENESVWLHMSYKYLLELLRVGLYEEFFADAETMLVPFMNPEVYGRSVLENSSFLASSANPDPSTHGRGFIARLSGSTAEFIHIWLLLTVGQNPFFMADGELRFRVQPALPGRWFTSAARATHHAGRAVEIPKNCFACSVLGTVLLVYHNDSRRDTFGSSAARPVRYRLDEHEPVNGASLGADLAVCLRQGDCRRLDVWLE